MTIRLHILFALALLSGCGGDTSTNSNPTPTPVPQAQLDAERDFFVKYALARHSDLLAAKYHISPQLAQAIVSDFRMSEVNLVQGVFTSPAPKVETMAQTIQRLSTTYQLSSDVIASLIMDELLLEHTLDEPPEPP